jgi:phenylacetate-coenzyme A ligase PaaK-like adenylate-forming protein
VVTVVEPVPELIADPAEHPDDYLRAVLRWHFSADTGSPFWLAQAEKFDFDPVTDIRTFADLARFPNVANELRFTRAEDLIPRGYGSNPDVIGVFESGGTTGQPKRVLLLRDWLDQLIEWSSSQLDAHGVPSGVNWLCVIPSGPHMVGEIIKRQAAYRNGMCFMVDLDPRWVKRLIVAGKSEEAGAYAEHLVEQLGYLLASQEIGVLMITPPVLERLARDEALVKLVNEKVRAINWVGTQMDADTRDLYRSEIFPDIPLYSGYGSTMILGNASERVGLTDDEPCIYDPFSPYMSFRVIDPETGDLVPYSERGQVSMTHASKSFFLPNNLERDYATRIAPPPGQVGDSVADVAPVLEFDSETVIEGVY